MGKTSGVAILAINQASDTLEAKRNASGFGSVLHPALGPAWDYNMDESMELCRKGPIREMRVVNSPKSKVGDTFKFKIKAEGFTSISEEGV
jgi:hypothetical protein